MIGFWCVYWSQPTYVGKYCLEVCEVCWTTLESGNYIERFEVLSKNKEDMSFSIFEYLILDTFSAIVKGFLFQITTLSISVFDSTK